MLRAIIIILIINIVINIVIYCFSFLINLNNVTVYYDSIHVILNSVSYCISPYFISLYGRGAVVIFFY